MNSVRLFHHSVVWIAFCGIVLLFLHLISFLLNIYSRVRNKNYWFYSSIRWKNEDIRIFEKEKMTICTVVESPKIATKSSIWFAMDLISPAAMKEVRPVQK